MWNFNFMIALSLCEGYRSILRANFMSGKKNPPEIKKIKNQRGRKRLSANIPVFSTHRKEENKSCS